MAGLTAKARRDQAAPMCRAWAVAAAVGLSLVTAGARQAPAPALSLIDVYQAGAGGYHTFRIPSLIAAGDGTLLAFAEGRKAGAGDAGDIDLVLKRSRDGGRTWSALQVIGDNGPNTFGNPCPVLDRATTGSGCSPPRTSLEGTPIVVQM